jgi:protein-disulfide isomerase
MRRLTALALAVLAGCASAQHLDTIDRRLQSIEEQEADTHKQLDRMQAAIAKVAGDLDDARARETSPERAKQLDELTIRLDQLAKDVATVQARPIRPAPVRAAPDPKDVYAVPVAGYPADGPPDALVTIVRAFDFACPFCERSRATMQELRALYPADVRIVYRAFVVHPVAQLPAQAACAAHKQGQFLEMERRLWDESFASHTFDQAEMERLAVEIGADLDRFRADMAGPCAGAVATDQQELTRFGVGATPTFFINGHYFTGAQPTTAFAAVIDQELALARSRIKGAGKSARKTYYATWILAKGLAQFTPPPPAP